MLIQISWRLKKPSDLDLHSLCRQGISEFSKTRVNFTTIWTVGDRLGNGVWGRGKHWFWWDIIGMGLSAPYLGITFCDIWSESILFVEGVIKIIKMCSCAISVRPLQAFLNPCPAEPLICPIFVHKQYKCKSVGFWGSQLIWIYSVCQYVNLYQQPWSINLIGWKLEVGVTS